MEIAAGGLIALCGALTFAELGGLYHASGAQYEILRDAYGPFPAFLFVFCNATAIQGGSIGIIALICAFNLLGAVGNSPSSGFGEPLVLVMAVTLTSLAIQVAAAYRLVAESGVRLTTPTLNGAVSLLLLVLALVLIAEAARSIRSGAAARTSAA